MKTILLDGLRNSPSILREFLEHIPEDQRRSRRKPGKWSIHENACHLANAEYMIHDRFLRFKSDPTPAFDPYIPGQTTPSNSLMDVDLEEALNEFEHQRSMTVALLESFDDKVWTKEGKHPQYRLYNAFILMRHTLMHDHFHMYRIEELWLTNDAYLI